MQEFVGFETEALLYNSQYTIADQPLTVGAFDDVTVVAARPTIEGNFLEELGGGVFASDGDLVSACLQPRSENRNAIRSTQSPLPSGTTNVHLADAVFGGVAFDHFGHFLLEATARLWALPDHRDKPWLFLTSGRPELRPYQRDFLALLGLPPDQIVIVNDRASVERLVIPEPAFVYHHWVTPAYLDAFRRSLSPSSNPGRRIFLSRSDTTMALTVGEHELEDLLRAEGWTIEIPERLPAADQARLFQDDNVVMGLQGSAMHLGLFAPEGRRVVHLCRGQAYRGYYILDDLTKANAVYLNAMRAHALASRPINGPFHLDLEATVAFLRQKELISAPGVSASVFPAETLERLDTDYEAWWHFTESQTRFHTQLAHDGSFADRTTALEFALNAARLRPDEPRILCHALALTLKLDGIKAASDLLSRSSLQPSIAATEDPQLLYMISLISDASGDSDRSLEAGFLCVRNAPTNPTYVNQLATSLFRRDRLDESEEVLFGLVKGGHANAESLFVLSLIGCKRGDIPVASEWALKAAAADKWNQPIVVHAAELLVQRNRREDAITLLIELVDRAPGNPDVLKRLAILEADLGRFADARAHVLQAYRHALSDDDLRQRCAVFLREDRFLPDTNLMALPQTPARSEQAVMIYLQSRSLKELGALDDALRTAVQALELCPTNTTIMEYAIGTAIFVGRILEAHILTHGLIEAGFRGGSMYYLASLIESQLGRRTAAQEAAAQAVALEPTNDLIRDHFERLNAA